MQNAVVLVESVPDATAGATFCWMSSAAPAGSLSANLGSMRVALIPEPPSPIAATVAVNADWAISQGSTKYSSILAFVDPWTDYAWQMSLNPLAALRFVAAVVAC